MASSSCMLTENQRIGRYSNLKNHNPKPDALQLPECDVTLVCHGHEFLFPRKLLLEASPVFRAMFGTGFEEARTGRANFESIDADVMEIILLFISAKCIHSVKRDDVIFWCQLLEASHLLQMNDLSIYCQRQMSGHIKPDCFLAPWTMANLYDFPGFSAMIRTAVANNFDEVVRTEDYLLLNFDQLKEVVMHPELAVCSMDVFVDAMVKWVDFDSENRNVHLLELLDLVDLSSLSKGYLSNLICHRLVKRSYRIRSRLYSAASGLKHSKSVCLKPTTARRSKKLYCFGSKKDKQILATYDFDNHQWLPVEYIPFTVTAGMAATFCGNRVYLAGGCDKDDPDKISSKIYTYYPETKTYSETRLLSPVSHAGAGVLHGYLYLVNGVDEKNRPSTSVQLYDPVKDICRHVVATKQSHVRPFIGVYADYLHVTGSCDESQKDVERYNSYTCQWTTITTTAGPVDWCHATLCGHELFVVRSVCDGMFQVYDMKELKWKEVEFCEPCPDRIWGLWSVYYEKEDTYYIIARGKSHVLHFFNLANECWEESSEPNENLWYGPQTVVSV